MSRQNYMDNPSNWREDQELYKLVNSASTLVAVFDQNKENTAKLRQWREAAGLELEWLWFDKPVTASEIEKAAAYCGIAFISLDDAEGFITGRQISILNPDCIICFCKHEPFQLDPLRHSRPYEHFVWRQGRRAFLEKLEDMVCRIVFSGSIFCFPTKQVTLCYPVRNIRYFESVSGNIRIQTVLGNDVEIRTNMTRVEKTLEEQHLRAMFLRCHRSYLVNRAHILRMDKERTEDRVTGIKMWKPRLVLRSAEPAADASGQDREVQVPISESYLKSVRLELEG